MVSHKMPGTFINPSMVLPGAIKPITDISNTAQAPVDNTTTPTTNNTDTKPQVNLGGTTQENKDAINPSTPAPIPTTKTEEPITNTGDGIESALGTEYSWDTKAEERADLAYQSDVLKSKQQFLTNRQEIEVQGQQAQQEFTMKEYSQNQSNEKAGWTGGYILDTERQMNYLKQTIQSQMYGQMELQKYGYDTSLAAARLAYDTNKYDLALEYYNTALSRAVSEAEITGYYVSPEAQDMINQYAIASKQLEEGIDTDRAQKVIDSINTWFEANGISKQGVETITHREFIYGLKAAAKQSANFTDESLFKVDINSFGEVDENGQLVYSQDNTSVNMLHFDKMSNEDIISYANRSDTAKQQVMGYIDGLLYQDINRYLDTVKKVEGENTTYNVSEESFRTYLNNHSLSTINSLLENSGDLFSDYSLEALLDKTPITFKINTEKDLDILIEGKKETGKLILDDLESTVDEVNGIVTNDLYVYKIDPVRGYVKTGYNTSNITKIRQHILDTTGVKTWNTILDMTKPQSEWGGELDQTDFDHDTSKGKAGEYINKIKEDSLAGKIPIGEHVVLNYGNVWDDWHYYIHLGNGKFIESRKIFSQSDNYYVPSGYKKGWGTSGIVKK